ncbi:MAG: hypothetical protein ACE5KH_01125 [Candidatus Geothermarchaeales archaeon]
MRGIVLAPKGERGSIHESTVELEAGQKLTYGYKTSGLSRVAFNIHRHIGSSVTYYVEEEANEGKGVFQASAKGTYYLMWQNIGPSEAEVSYSHSTT